MVKIDWPFFGQSRMGLNNFLTIKEVLKKFVEQMAACGCDHITHMGKQICILVEFGKEGGGSLFFKC